VLGLVWAVVWVCGWWGWWVHRQWVLGLALGGPGGCGGVGAGGGWGVAGSPLPRWGWRSCAAGLGVAQSPLGLVGGGGGVGRADERDGMGRDGVTGVGEPMDTFGT